MFKGLCLEEWNMEAAFKNMLLEWTGDAQFVYHSEVHCKGVSVQTGMLGLFIGVHEVRRDSRISEGWGEKERRV